MRFYVYRIFGEAGETVYVGKGKGRRFATQCKRFMAKGEIVKHLKSEKAAYNLECKLIAKHRPPLNLNAGGGGALERIARRAYRPSKEDLEMRRLGTRVFAARKLLHFQGIDKYLTPDQILSIKQVANGKT